MSLKWTTSKYRINFGSGTAVGTCSRIHFAWKPLKCLLNDKNRHSINWLSFLYFWTFLVECCPISLWWSFSCLLTYTGPAKNNTIQVYHTVQRIHKHCQFYSSFCVKLQKLDPKSVPKSARDTPTGQQSTGQRKLWQINFGLGLGPVLDL